MALESDYQTKLRKRIERRFPGCFIMKNDPTLQQGIPDLTILYKDMWAILEVKRSEREGPEPNQEWFIDKFNRMSFAAFIFPENEEEVLRDLQLAFEPRRPARLSQR